MKKKTLLRTLLTIIFVTIIVTIYVAIYVYAKNCFGTVALSHLPFLSIWLAIEGITLIILLNLFFVPPMYPLPKCEKKS